ncbi:mannitol dehydrogenase family protein [Pseudoclavibacter sp. VKM Ac-2867]|uniref:mannitol dehydrogenase family protein n=1 Tax=Pseudoclavibacter sp. VKM Ac-2867 TaxID=2783829 RepID=UPI00188A51EB|nr:mannitol dehydrogenase family protein [Pseudoclavibacter sp. VKM Ac-2867]MBF4460108.1 mannitol dehydrogenase family protein [Pseudoclavibacter sp. VKM Ac-2867]
MTTAEQEARRVLLRDQPAPPVRIVHLGLGAFSRSHTAWYTSRAEDHESWGISAYTGRSHELSDALERQDGVYTLVERGSDVDTATRVDSVVRAHPGGQVDEFVADLASPATAIVTLTITERGYCLVADGTLDSDDPEVLSDLEILRAAGGAAAAGAKPTTALGKLALGLEARRRSEGGAIALISCDNIPDNGALLRAALLQMAEVLPGLVGWCEEHVSFVSTSIDRITPRLSGEELERLSSRYGDLAPVVAEPFSDWVLEGDFPAGRPMWETAGARFTDELAPWESRKLWMLNGAHTLLASLGQLRGHRTVAQAINDSACLRAVGLLWDEAERHLPADLMVAEYREALIGRFENPRIEHRLAQIAADSSTKVRLRISPVAELELAAGRRADGCAAAIAAWIAAASRGLVPGFSGSDAATPTTDFIAAVSDGLAEDRDFVARVDAKVSDYQRGFTL